MNSNIFNSGLRKFLDNELEKFECGFLSRTMVYIYIYYIYIYIYIIKMPRNTLSSN